MTITFLGNALILISQISLLLAFVQFSGYIPFYIKTTLLSGLYFFAFF